MTTVGKIPQEERELTVAEKLIRARAYGDGYRAGYEVGCASHSSASGGCKGEHIPEEWICPYAVLCRNCKTNEIADLARRQERERVLKLLETAINESEIVEWRYEIGKRGTKKKPELYEYVVIEYRVGCHPGSDFEMRVLKLVESLRGEQR